MGFEGGSGSATLSPRIADLIAHLAERDAELARFSRAGPCCVHALAPSASCCKWISLWLHLHSDVDRMLAMDRIWQATGLLARNLSKTLQRDLGMQGAIFLRLLFRVHAIFLFPLLEKLIARPCRA